MTIRYCPMGLGHVVVPIEAEGRIVGSLECGRVRAHPPRLEEFWRVSEPGSTTLPAGQLKDAAAAFLVLPVLTRERLAAAGRLLATLAQPVASRLALSAEPMPSDRFGQVLSYITERIAEPLRLAQVARHAGLGPEYLCRLFKKRTGITFTRHVAQVRLERACRLLRESDLKITEVAEAAGFQSLWQFNYLFRKSLRSTPTEYRSRAKVLSTASPNQPV